MKTVRIIPKETQATKLQNVAAYARVSREFEPNVHSLSSQVEYYDSLIKKNPLWSFAGVYSDSGLTGTKKNRPGFQSLIEDCTKGKIDIVLTKSISRFARNTVDLLETTRKLRDLRIPVIFEKEQINSMTEDGELMLSLLASFAQEESRSISENIKWGIRRNFEKGIGNNFNRMYGYKYDGQKFVLVDEEADIVRDIFSSYLNGSGPFAIATMLNEKGYKTANGNPFTYSTIWGMLRCEKYAGCSLFQKTYHDNHMNKKNLTNHGELQRFWAEGTHPQIISLETFNEVQNEINRRSTMGNRANQNISFSIFSGKVFCSECGHTYRRNPKGDGRALWRCGKKLDKGKLACGSNGVSEKILLQMTGEVLGCKDFSEEMFNKKINRIEVCQPNKLAFFLSDGTTVIKEYKKMENNRNQSPFTGMLVCSTCNHIYKRHQASMKNRITPYYKWVCNFKLRNGSHACASENIPETALIRATQKALGKEEFSHEELQCLFKRIEVHTDHTLVFVFRDDSISTIDWKEV